MKEISVGSLVKAYIDSKHGWAVGDQFEDTFSNGESFENQNHNALRYIRSAVKDVIDVEILNDEAQDELRDYIDRLETYLY